MGAAQSPGPLQPHAPVVPPAHLPFVAFGNFLHDKSVFLNIDFLSKLQITFPERSLCERHCDLQVPGPVHLDFIVHLQGIEHLTYIYELSRCQKYRAPIRREQSKPKSTCPGLALLGTSIIPEG